MGSNYLKHEDDSLEDVTLVNDINPGPLLTPDMNATTYIFEHNSGLQSQVESSVSLSTRNDSVKYEKRENILHHKSP